MGSPPEADAERATLIRIMEWYAGALPLSLSLRLADDPCPLQRIDLRVGIAQDIHAGTGTSVPV